MDFEVNFMETGRDAQDKGLVLICNCTGDTTRKEITVDVPQLTMHNVHDGLDDIKDFSSLETMGTTFK